MQNFLLMTENQYKASASSTNSTMSLIKLRLDVSSLSATKKSSASALQGFFLLLSKTDHKIILPPPTAAAS
jgi:hypothetical protein